ncbi:MAG: hypothetical protein KatS3mg115_1974 [Candidatus Poribacteria bacterium]|nr:MAG: hypothetical protein KatS3mg115_1974 [Candidatus Poribacteria bacterium]
MAIVLDTSASMGYQGLNGVPFHRAQETAAGLLRSLRPGDTATLILAAERPRVLFDPPTPQIGDVIQAVLTAEPTPLGTRLLPAVERALAMLQRAETPNRELYVLSDFARHGWESAPLKARACVWC